MAHLNKQKAEPIQDLFQVAVNVDLLNEAHQMLKNTGALSNTLIKYITDYKFLVLAFKCRFDDPGIPDVSIATQCKI